MALDDLERLEIGNSDKVRNLVLEKEDNVQEFLGGDCWQPSMESNGLICLEWNIEELPLC